MRPQPTGLAAMGVPAASFDHHQADALRRREHRSGHATGFGSLVGTGRSAIFASQATCRNEALPKFVQLRIGCIKLGNAAHQIRGRARQMRRRVTADRLPAAQRHGDIRRVCQRAVVIRRQQRNQPVHPAAALRIRQQAACFENVLAVEVRAIPVG